MTHKLLLEIPDDIYSSLVKTAEQTGQPPEELAVKWLANATRRPTDDPLEKFIGAFRSDIPDLADQHDKYIGESQLKALDGSEHEDNNYA
jgi:hypothetical protein